MRTFRWVIGSATLVALGAAVWWWQSSEVESELLGEAPYRILAKYEAAEYARILDAWRAYQAGARNQADFVRESNATFGRVATRRFASASQASLLALVEDTVRTVKKLHGKSPEACFRYFYPEVAGPPDVTNLLTAEEQRHTLMLMGEVVRSSAESPAPRPSQDEVERALADVINATYEQYGADAQMAAHPEDPRVDRAKVCVITTSLYERILALPPELATKLLRYMAP